MSHPLDAVPRIGLGTDRHRLVAGRPCRLGGIAFPECPVGPEGHSDGDAVLHALTDALCGAAGLDDLGTLFPDDDPRWAGADSGQLLQAVLEALAARGLVCWSVDVCVHADRPKIAPRRAEMRAHLAELLGLPVDRVNLKGKTLEGLGGPQEGVEVLAVALLGRRSAPR